MSLSSRTRQYVEVSLGDSIAAAELIEVIESGGNIPEVDPLSLKSANNLSDLDDASEARDNLGLGASDSPAFSGIDSNGTFDLKSTTSTNSVLHMYGSNPDGNDSAGAVFYRVGKRGDANTEALVVGVSGGAYRVINQINGTGLYRDIHVRNAQFGNRLEVLANGDTRIRNTDNNNYITVPHAVADGVDINGFRIGDTAGFLKGQPENQAGTPNSFGIRGADNFGSGPGGILFVRGGDSSSDIGGPLYLSGGNGGLEQGILVLDSNTEVSEGKKIALNNSLGNLTINNDLADSGYNLLIQTQEAGQETLLAIKPLTLDGTMGSGLDLYLKDESGELEYLSIYVDVAENRYEVVSVAEGGGTIRDLFIGNHDTSNLTFKNSGEIQINGFGVVIDADGTINYFHTYTGSDNEFLKLGSLDIGPGGGPEFTIAASQTGSGNILPIELTNGTAKFRLDGNYAEMAALVGAFTSPVDGDTRFELSSWNQDNSESVELRVHGYGPAIGADKEYLSVGFNAAGVNYRIATKQEASGSLRELALGVGSIDSIVVNTSNNIELRQDTRVSEDKFLILENPTFSQSWKLGTVTGFGEFSLKKGEAGHSYMILETFTGDASESLIMTFNGLVQDNWDENEFMTMGWDSSLQTYYVGTQSFTNGGPAVHRPFTIFTGPSFTKGLEFFQDSSIKSWSNLEIDDDKNVRFQGSSGVDTNIRGNDFDYGLIFEAITTDGVWHNFYATPSDASQDVQVDITGLGAKGDGASWHGMGMGYTTSLGGAYVLSAQSTGATTTPPLIIAFRESGDAYPGVAMIRIEDNETTKILSNLEIQGELRSPNVVAATVPGAVTGKLEVFDETGASQGFLALYASIT